MKKVLSFLLAILVIGTCATPDANAQKKRSKRNAKQTTATQGTKAVNTDVFPNGTWQTPLPGAGTLEITFNAAKGTFTGRFYDVYKQDMGGTVVTLDGGVTATGTYKYANDKITLTAKPANIIPKGTCKFSNYNTKGRDKEKQMSDAMQQKAEALVPLAKQLFNGSFQVSNVSETSFKMNIYGDVAAFEKVK